VCALQCAQEKLHFLSSVRAMSDEATPKGAKRADTSPRVAIVAGHASLAQRLLIVTIMAGALIMTIAFVLLVRVG
jgi:hypothetical protein